MSRQIANISLVGFAVGQGSKIPLAGVTPPPTIAQQMRPSQVEGSTLLLFNESGSGLTCTFPASLESFTLAAGAWKQIMVPPNEVELDFTVTYILNATAPVSQLLADLYLPGEAIDSVGVLGNSPISGATSLTTKIPINTTGGNQVAIEMGPDVHSLADWELVVDQAGDLIVFDNKNARAILGFSLTNILFTDNNAILQLGVDTTSATQTPIKLIDAHSGKTWAFEMDASGNLIFRDTTDGNQWVFGAPGGLTIFPAAIFQIAGQATVGKFGVPVVAAVTKDIAVTDNAQHTVVTLTTPNDGANHIFRVWLESWVGAGNTNPANFVCPVSFTDPIFGAVAPNVNDYFTGQSYNGGHTYVQGNAYPSAIVQFECTANTAITLKYQNSQAGTISDHASGTIELLT